MNEVVCALCGTPSPVWQGHVPPQPAGPADFDTRPAEPLRGTILEWVQSCANCGYCAEDIGKAHEGVGLIVESDDYRALHDDHAIPGPARRFLCFSHLLGKLHQHADAGWSALHAAWVCDDASAHDAARTCRALALSHWQQGKQAGQQFADGLATEFALATDLYRRIGEFENATVACAEGLDLEDIPPVLERLLRRQTVLIQKRDTSAHSMRELLSH